VQAGQAGAKEGLDVVAQRGHGWLEISPKIVG
jgi:hypothetical protein